MKILKVLLFVLAALVLSAGSCLGYIGYRAQHARSLVETFCKSVSVGQSSVGLAERARAGGLDVSELPERANEEGVSPGSTLLCTQGVFLARHICEVKVSGGHVIKVEKSFLD